MHIIAADIGGTNCRLILCRIEGQYQTVLSESVYQGANYKCFDHILDEFLENYQDLTIDKACIAVAGPVKSSRVSITNLPWHLTVQQLQQYLKTSCVKLINDFSAVAYAIPHFGRSDFVVIQQGESVKYLDAVVIGAGTGLGAARLLMQDSILKVYPSETGHAGFAPANQLETELLVYLQKQGYVSIETVLSGKGLYRIYQFLNETSGIAESAVIRQAIRNNDPAQVITTLASREEDELCVKALDCFVEIYGAVAGDIVLHHYPVSELYIAGGIAPKIHHKIKSDLFIQALVAKGPMTENLQQLTVKLVSQEKAGLYGALAYARSL